jgi:hypothetical protein
MHNANGKMQNAKMQIADCKLPIYSGIANVFGN